MLLAGDEQKLLPVDQHGCSGKGQAWQGSEISRKEEILQSVMECLNLWELLGYHVFLGLSV